MCRLTQTTHPLLHYHKHINFHLNINLHLSLSLFTMQLAMAPHALVSPSPLSSHSFLRSSFSGVSLKLSPQFPTLSPSNYKSSLTVLAATKKAVAVLKGNSTVEGVVTLTQEDDGISYFFSLNNRKTIGCCVLLKMNVMHQIQNN